MLPYSLQQSVGPSVEPVSLTELKAHLHVDHTDDDLALTGLIALGRQAVERDTGRSLITQTWVLRMDEWPARCIELLHPPVQSVSSITYVDGAGVTQTWSSAEYVVDLYSQPGLVRLAYGCSWPSVRGDDRGIAVTYVTGYGAAGSDVPYELRQAMLLRCQLEYDGWNADAFGTLRGAADAYDRIVRGLRVGVYP